MADKITTLHPRGTPQDNVYPKIKGECIPDDAVEKRHLGFQLWANHCAFNSVSGSFTRNAMFTIFAPKHLSVSEIKDYLSSDGWTPACGSVYNNTSSTNVCGVSLDDDDDTKLNFLPVNSSTSFVVSIGENLIISNAERLI